MPQTALYQYGMQLVKLHGSVNWTVNRQYIIEEHEYNTTYDERKSRTGSQDIQEDIMIYPLSQKQLYFTPFIQFFRILEAELSKRVFWIIIGYSFRDIIIRTIFERVLAENTERKILLIHAHGNEQVKPLFQEGVRNQIKCLDKYSAKKDFKKVNTEIINTLLDLA
jgi:SIR2-like domain